MKKGLCFVACVLVFLCISTIVFGGGAKEADKYPERDITGVIMWGAGGATDVVIRALVPHAEKELKRSIVLVNRTGGTGAVATQYVYSQPSDGYTLLCGAENPQLYRILKLLDLDYRDFYPVNISAMGVGAFVVNADAPWKDFKELLDFIHQNPGKLKMGITGIGGLPFTATAMIQTVTKFDVVKVPFDGEGPGITALLGKHVDMMPVGIGAAQEHVRAGRLKVLALLAKSPVEGLPYPLITQYLPELEKFLPWGPFYGVWVKKDVPDPIKQKLVAAFKVAAANPEFKKVMENRGNVVLNIAGEEAQKFLNQWQSVTAWIYEAAGEAKVSPASVGIPKP